MCNVDAQVNLFSKIRLFDFYSGFAFDATFFDQIKENESLFDYRLSNYKRSNASFSKPAVAGFTFFLLEQKEPKNQDKPDPSGRFVNLPLLGGYLSGADISTVNYQLQL